MVETLLTQWQANPMSDTTAIIVPDGCRDLIIKFTPGEPPQQHVSPLYDQATPIAITAGTSMVGFRFRPGVIVDEKKLLASLPEHYAKPSDIVCQLNDFTRRNNVLEEALACLATNNKSIADVTKQLAINHRALQRLSLKETGRTPIYWMLLARIRRTARAVTEPTPLAEIADRFGYADQAHMSREFKRWLNISPSALRREPDILRQLNATGYD